MTEATSTLPTAEGQRGERPSLAPVRVIFVGGMGRSGSTLLDRMMGQLPGCFAVGEMGAFLWRQSLQLNWRCGCGEHFSDCPFWQAVGEHAFGGWDALDLDEVLRLRAEVDKTRSVPALIHPSWPKSFADKVSRYGDLLAQLYQSVAAVSGAQVIVDSSKLPSTGYLLRHVPGVQLSLLHLVRDPRGVVHSWSKGTIGSGSDRGTPRMSIAPAQRTVRRYWTVNAMIEGLPVLGVPAVRMRYEDLVRDPRTELKRLSPLLPQPVTDNELGFIGEQSVHLAACHTNAGNPGSRSRTGTVPLRLDEQWRTALSPSDRQLIDRLTLPLRYRYGYR